MCMFMSLHLAASIGLWREETFGLSRSAFVRVTSSNPCTCGGGKTGSKDGDGAVTALARGAARMEGARSGRGGPCAHGARASSRAGGWSAATWRGERRASTPMVAQGL